MSEKAKSIENLLKAANDASGQARNMWLGFLGLLTYLLVTIAGVTHKDLLLNSPITLPIVNVEIPLFSFFIYAPVLLLIFHLGLLIQHAMLANRLHTLNNKLSDGRYSAGLVHDYRSLLHSYVVTQLIAGPERHALLGFFMRLMVWVSLLVLPVVTLCLFQYGFLPYHNVPITYWHRFAFTADIAVLFGIWPFIRMPKISHVSRYVEYGENAWAWRSTRRALWFGGFFVGVLTLFNWFVATVPDEAIDEAMASSPWWVVEKNERRIFAPTAWFFEAGAPQSNGSRESWFSRNLTVTDTDMVPDKKWEPDEVTHSLRGRDLRYAVLDRSDLHRVDFTGANLKNASFFKTKLGNAKFRCAGPGEKEKKDKEKGGAAGETDKQLDSDCVDLRGAYLRKAKLRGANLREANMQGADLSEAELQGADLRKANLQGANLSGAELQRANFRKAELQRASLFKAKLQGANLFDAELQGADLRTAKLQGANLSRAHLQEANLRDAELQGAELIKAELQEAKLIGAWLPGADLNWAEMQGADLSFAKIQGANLIGSQLQGADLIGSQLQGADLREAGLQGANLSFAQLQGADVSEARIWQTKPPASAGLERAMPMDTERIAALSVTKKSELRKLISDTRDRNLKVTLQKKLEPLLDADAQRIWESSPDRKAWVDFSKRPGPNSFDLSNFLGELACNDETGGYIVKGIARRISSFSTRKNDYAILTAKKLIDKETCLATEYLSDKTLTRLNKIAASELKVLQSRPEK